MVAFRFFRSGVIDVDFGKMLFEHVDIVEKKVIFGRFVLVSLVRRCKVVKYCPGGNRQFISLSEDDDEEESLCIIVCSNGSNSLSVFLESFSNLTIGSISLDTDSIESVEESSGGQQRNIISKVFG